MSGPKLVVRDGFHANPHLTMLLWNHGPQRPRHCESFNPLALCLLPAGAAPLAEAERSRRVRRIHENTSAAVLEVEPILKATMVQGQVRPKAHVASVAVALGALGIVYGDIVTSRLYALRETGR